MYRSHAVAMKIMCVCVRQCARAEHMAHPYETRLCMAYVFCVHSQLSRCYYSSSFNCCRHHLLIIARTTIKSIMTMFRHILLAMPYMVRSALMIDDFWLDYFFDHFYFIEHIFGIIHFAQQNGGTP